MRSLATIVTATWLVLGAACQSPKSRTLLPPVPQTGDVAARSRFSELKRQFEQDGHVAPDEFQVVATEFPDDPIAPHALLYAAKSARKAGDVAAAQAALDTLVKDSPDADPAIARRVRLELGLTIFETGGQPGDAFPYLEGAEAATETAGEREQWLYATYVTSGSQGLAVAWPWHFRAWKEIGLRIVPEYCNKVWMCITYDDAATQGLVDVASRDELVAAWSARGAAAWPGVSLVGRKLLVAGSWEIAETRESVRQAVIANDRALGLEVAAAPMPLGLREIGALIPQSGKSVRLGEALERMLGQKGQAADDRLWLHDSNQGAATMATLIGRGVKAVVGPVDADAHAALVPTLEAKGVTSISLSLVAEEFAARPHQFFVVHSATARARALARYAQQRGLRGAVVLAVDSGYGKAVSAAFVAEAKTLGLKTTLFSYDSKATNFGAVVAKVAKGTSCIFIADSAPRIELIAPALAAAGHKAMAVGKKGGFVLLSTADGLGAELLASAGRYLLGAVFAPGFAANAVDAVSAEVVAQYQAATGKLPSALEAYAFDAVTLLQTAGAGVPALATTELVGLTGTIRFGADRRRADDGVLYVVVDDEATGLRALTRLAK
ncbi:MAG: penicillin-binding protein activator [Myxococcales bacterium]|nr:penicillin-binding protein activator [Myxococcales bacterium]